MKRLIFLLLVVPMSLRAQSAAAVYIANDSSYATTDTTAWKSVSAMKNYTLVIHAADSFNVSIRLDFRNAAAAATVFQSYNVEADSTNSTNAAGFFKGYVLRKFGTDNIPGAQRVRLIVTKKTTLNGTTSPTYDAFLETE